MHHPARTAPCPGGARPSAVALLAAVALTLLVAVGLARPSTAATSASAAAVATAATTPATAATPATPATAGGPAAGAVAAAGHHRDAGPHADEGCDPVCAVRAAPRQEPHREHPAPRCHLAGCPQGTTVTPPHPARLAEPTGHIPSSDPHAPRDRGRAPPEASGA